MTSAVASARTKTLIDSLANLPAGRIVEYRKTEPIYWKGQGPAGLYLVVDGKVKVCRTLSDGNQIVMDIYQAEEFFGEAAFVGKLEDTEMAIALSHTRVRMWTTNEIEDLAGREPQVRMALIQGLAGRSMELWSRIASLSAGSVAHRLARALIRFSERMDEPLADGSVELIPLTHEFLAQYVGTTRERVTMYMVQFRRRGYLGYSRKHIRLFPAMKDWLCREAETHCGFRRI